MNESYALGYRLVSFTLSRDVLRAVALMELEFAASTRARVSTRDEG